MVTITSKTKEGKGWERQFKELTLRHYRLMEIIKNAKDNFDLEECEECGNLKRIGKECLECYL